MLPSITIFLICSVILIVACAPLLGVQRHDKRSYTSLNYNEGKFHNSVSTIMNTSDQGMIRSTLDFLRGDPRRTPDHPLPAVAIADSVGLGKENLQVTWLGHSTCLIEIDGQFLLTDPMFSDRASPVSFLGPKRFARELNFKPEDLPKIDAVLISHDHYDHLDYHSILALQNKVKAFYVPLGVGRHLKRWGIADSQVIEMEWWQEQKHQSLTFVATPARHFSGRGLADRNKTLWSSWVILGKEHRVFFGGDSGYFSGFKKIGEKYGPFDITMLESGAYDKTWAQIHMMPEETVQAHLDLRGGILLPIHWAAFNLALHPWEEPIKRLLHQADISSVTVATPKIGESFDPLASIPQTAWWKFQTASLTRSN